MEEIWKEIHGYEGLYLVSNTGIVKSIERRTPKIPGKKVLDRIYPSIIRKTRISNKGYVQVSLCKLGKRWNAGVQRLVAMTFIPNPENKREVNHKDGNKLNNNVDNLEWATSSENKQHALKNTQN